MTIYEFSDSTISAMKTTSFKAEGISERADLQAALRDQVGVISPDTLIISEEFSGWEDSRRRIDLLGIDKEANVVVIELKVTEDGGHLELQAVRYAAMVSNMTFEDAITTYQKYLKQRGIDADAETELLEFLGWSDSSDGDFGSDVRIVLAAGDFSKEVTSAVLWLKSKDVDISCVRIKPYKDGQRILLDVQTIIPLPEALDYQVGIERKKKAQEVKRGTRDTRKFDITIGSEVHSRLSRQRAMLQIISNLCKKGASPEEINKQITWRKELFCKVKGDVSSAQFVEFAKEGGKSFNANHYFCNQNELIRHGGDTYALTRKWGPKTTKAIEKLISKFASDGSVTYQLCGSDTRQ